MEPDHIDEAPLSRWWALPGLALAIVITHLVHQFASFVRAEAAGISSGVVFALTLAAWKRHRERWFWPSVAAAIVVHALAVWLIPWPEKHEFQKSDLNFVWLDLFLTGFIADQIIRRTKERT